MNQVYYYPLNDNPSLEQQVAAIKKLVTIGKLPELIAADDYVAIKLHVGEEHNTTHVKPELIRAVVSTSQDRSNNVFLTETATLYKGQRDNAIKHLIHAQRQGFGIESVGAPFVMADGLTGNSEVEVTVNGELEKTVKIAREIAFCDVLVVVSHPTGHIVTGLGACLKNIGMGLASRAGKLRQHSAMLPEIDDATCRFCGKCIQWCPKDAIINQANKAFILKAKCIGCGECLTACRYDAVKYNWGIESEQLQKSMVEHAWGVIKEKTAKCFYINVLVGMTGDCDCYAVNQPKKIPDLGILASRDPVAIDKATLDLTIQANGKSLAELSYEKLNPLIQLEHAVKLGMGTMGYELVTIDG